MFRQAFAVDRRDPQLLAAMKRVAQREGTVDEELAALAAEAEGQGPAAAPTFLQISKAYERLGRPEDALSALLAARRVSPNDPLILSELARIYEGQSRFEELADVLQAWGSNNTDESEFVGINQRLASLYEQLKRDVDAVGRYHAILNRVPGHAGALAGLGKLHYRAQNWQGLLDTYEAEAAAIDDPRQKAGRVYKAAETLEERLNRVDDAIARYNTCLQLSPGYLPAQKALIRLYEKLGKWADLVAMYEQDLLQTDDREQQISTLNKIAALYEDRSTTSTHAIECLKRVLDLSPDHLPTMRNLGRLYERGSKWQELLDLNETETRLASDTKQIVSLAHRNAEILEEQLKDRPAAIHAWERVLQLSPAYLPALRALGRLYGQDGRWEALIKMYRAEAEIAPSTDQAASLIQKVGELFEQKVKDLNEAISSYREVLTLAPNHVPALAFAGAHLPLAGRLGVAHRDPPGRGGQPQRPHRARQRHLPVGGDLGRPAAEARGGDRGVPRGAPARAQPHHRAAAARAAADHQGRREGADRPARSADADGHRRGEGGRVAQAGPALPRSHQRARRAPRPAATPPWCSSRRT